MRITKPRTNALRENEIWQDNVSQENNTFYIHAAKQADDTSTSTAPEKHVTNAQLKVYADHGKIVNGNPHGTDHSQIENIEGTGNRHITANENAEITALDGLAAGMVAKTANAAYSARTITGTSGEITVTNGDGISGNPTISLPDTITTPLKFGTATNYSTFDADGTLVMTGDATVWEDLNFDPSSSGGPPVSLPDYVTINNVYHREFTSSNNQTCGDGEELPHQYKLGSQIYPHMHVFLKSGETAGTTGVTFTFYWELRQSTGTTSGSVSLSATSTELTNNPHKLNIIDSTGFAGSAELGAQLALRIDRVGGNAGDIVVITYGVHYEIDQIGSHTISVK